MYDAQFWAKAWEEYRQAGNRRRPDPNAWIEYWNCFAGRYAKHNEATIDVHQNIIDNLAAQGAVKPGDTLIDIGCGPGTYALPLAAKGVNVTGLDTAKHMLDTLQETATAAELSENISCLQADWRNIAPEPTYDVAFAAKSPAINDYDSLMKMTKAAKRTCCLIGFAGQHDLDLRRLLWEKLLGELAPAPSFDIIYPLNILYQEGYRPNITFYSYSQTHDEPLDYLVPHYIRYFAMFGINGTFVEDNIQSFLENRAVNGLCTEKTATTVGVMWWNINRS